MLLSDPDEIAFLRIRLAEQARDLAALREAASDAAEAAAARLRAARQDAAALRRSLDEAETQAARSAAGRAEPDALPAMPVRATEAASVPLPPAAPAAALPRRRLHHAAALPIWRLIRPVARPMLWRARIFFTADVVRELAELRAVQREMRRAMLDAAPETAQDQQPGAAPLPAPAAPRREPIGAPGQGLGLGDTAAERWLLTVALESAQTRDSLESAQARHAPNAQAA